MAIWEKAPEGISEITGITKGIEGVFDVLAAARNAVTFSQNAHSGTPAPAPIGTVKGR